MNCIGAKVRVFLCLIGWKDYEKANKIHFDAGDNNS